MTSTRHFPNIKIWLTNSPKPAVDVNMTIFSLTSRGPTAGLLVGIFLFNIRRARSEGSCRTKIDQPDGAADGYADDIVWIRWRKPIWALMPELREGDFEFFNVPE